MHILHCSYYTTAHSYSIGLMRSSSISWVNIHFDGSSSSISWISVHCNTVVVLFSVIIIHFNLFLELIPILMRSRTQAGSDDTDQCSNNISVIINVIINVTTILIATAAPVESSSFDSSSTGNSIITLLTSIAICMKYLMIELVI